MNPDLQTKLATTHKQIRFTINKELISQLNDNLPEDMLLSDFVDGLLKLAVNNKHYVNWIKNNR